MKKFDQLSKLQLRELLNKNWMTHDGMWFYNCLQECGIEKTNKINKAAVRMMAMIEVKRIKKILGLPEIRTFEDLKTLLEEGFEIIRADFMDFHLHFPAKNVFVWDIPNTIDSDDALDAMKRYNEFLHRPAPGKESTAILLQYYCKRLKGKKKRGISP